MILKSINFCLATSIVLSFIQYHLKLKYLIKSSISRYHKISTQILRQTSSNNDEVTEVWIIVNTWTLVHFPVSLLPRWRQWLVSQVTGDRWQVTVTSAAGGISSQSQSDSAPGIGKSYYKQHHQGRHQAALTPINPIWNLWNE